MALTPSIYVEILMRGPMDDLWRHTQTPDLHALWDLRFTDIEYLPRPDESEPQRFLYATRLGFGLRIEGAGETVGSLDNPDSRTSALKFWSDDPKSLIRTGSGYWKYIQTDAGVQFLTRYDYETRFGVIGRVIDRLVFRPLIGWATAWSFDRLRLLLEQGQHPSATMERAAIHAVARIGLAMIWLYQGLVPKMFFATSSGEIDTVIAAGFPAEHARAVLFGAGGVEVLFGLAMLVFWRLRALLLINVVVLVGLAITVVFADPALYVKQFNPLTLNLSMSALALAGWISSRRELPSAKNCLRHPKEPTT